MPDPITATVGAVAGVGSSVVGAKSAKDAAKSAEKAGDKATAAQLQMFAEVQETLAPFVGGGEAAFNAYLGDVGVPGFEKYATGNLPQIMSPEEYAKSVEFKFGMEQGLDAIESGAAARGGVLSGQAVRESQQFGQEYGMSTYEQYRSRAVADQQRYLQNLFGAAQVGQSSAAQQASVGAQTGSSIAQTQLAVGQTQAQSQIAQGQAISGLFGDIATGVAYGAGSGLFGA